MENIKYTRLEMEERLPDFIFGRLPELEQMIFQNSLPDFPDLQNEIVEVKNVFSKLEKIDFNRIADDKTRNIHSNILAKTRKKRSANTNQMNWKYLVPALLILVVSAFVLNYNSNQTSVVVSSNSKSYSKQLDSIISTEELKNINKNDLSFALLTNYGSEHISSQIPSEYTDEVDSYLTDSYSKFINSADKNVKVQFVKANSKLDNSIAGYLDNVDEEQFEKILDEVSNVDFKN